MKYLVLLYSEPGAWPPDEHKVALEESIALCHEMHARGQYCGAAPLQPPSTATSVRVREGKRIVSDGPYAETKEQIGGFLLLEARDMNQAIELMSKHPGVKAGPFEIRAVEDMTEVIRQSEQRRSKAK